MTDDNPLSRSHQLLWEGLPQSKKGPRPTLSLEQIVEAGIAIADADGLEGLSMRRLAVDLGMGTMSLYRYVPTKGDLLNLMLDHVAGAQVDRLTTQQGWRETLHSAARKGRELYLHHRWLIQVNWTRPVLGPSSLTDLDVTMTGLTDLPFTDREKMMVVSLLDSYVTGSVRQEILYDHAAAETGMSDEEFWNLQLPVLVSAMESGRFPTLASMDEDTFSAGWEETFDFGLQFLLEGIEREVARRDEQ